MAAHARRGQAFIETVIFLPVFLIILFGVVWVVQSSVVNERLQFAVRYSGLISNQTSPFTQYSLYSLYENVEHSGSIPTGPQCFAPAVGVLTNSAPFPGPTSPPFWQPYSTGTPACAPGFITMSGGAFEEPAVFNETVSQISATTKVPSYLTLGPNPLSTYQNMSATQKFFSPPDMATMLKCYSSISLQALQSFEASGGSTSTAPAMLPQVTTPGSLALSC